MASASSPARRMDTARAATSRSTGSSSQRCKVDRPGRGGAGRRRRAATRVRSSSTRSGKLRTQSATATAHSSTGTRTRRRGASSRETAGAISPERRGPSDQGGGQQQGGADGDEPPVGVQAAEAEDHAVDGQMR